MTIDDQSFIDLAIHLRHASDELLVAAKRLAGLCDPAQVKRRDNEALLATLDSLVSMNHEFVAAEKLIRALWEANHEGVRLN